MFGLDTLTPAPAVGTLRVRKPIASLGVIEDVDGQRWDIGAITSGGVAAVPLAELHPYYTDTSGRSFGWVEQTWKPYKVEVVGS